MRLIPTLAAVVVAMTVALPSFAQIAPSLPSAPVSPPSGAVGGAVLAPPTSPFGQRGGQQERHGRIREEIRACMETHRAAITQQVKSHMQQWRSANEGATEEARHQERETVADPLIQAALQQCKASVRAQ